MKIKESVVIKIIRTITVSTLLIGAGIFGVLFSYIVLYGILVGPRDFP